MKGPGEISPVHQDTLHYQKKKVHSCGVVVCLYMSYLFGSHCKLYTPLTCFLSVMFVPSAHCVIWYIIGVEARGFMFGPSIALAIGAKFVPLRKPKKLPGII